MTESGNKRKFRDIQVANDVAVMAELGYFDVEFTMYGCAYLNPVDKKVYYKISPQVKDIYRFMEQAFSEDIYAGDILSMTQRLPVPSGMQYWIAQELKYVLAKKLQMLYPKPFFEELYRLAEYYRTDSAAELLWNETDGLEGLFDERKLWDFEQLVHFAYRCLKLSKPTYLDLLNWLNNERKNMNDNVICKDRFEKNMYGFAYEKDNQVYYIKNAQIEQVYSKLYDIEKEGFLATPIYVKTIWYNHNYHLLNVIEDFENVLRIELNDEYIAKIKKIKYDGSRINVPLYDALLKTSEAEWNSACIGTLKHYGYRWGIL